MRLGLTLTTVEVWTEEDVETDAAGGDTAVVEEEEGVVDEGQRVA